MEKHLIIAHSLHACSTLSIDGKAPCNCALLTCLKYSVLLTYMQVVTSTNDTSGRVLYESSACITVMLSRVAQVLRSSQSSGPETLNETAVRILDHAKTSGLVDHLCLCLATSGSNLISGSSNMLRAASEACRAVWSLINALDIIFMKKNATLFPINALWCHSFRRMEIVDQEPDPLVESESARIVDAVTRAFVRSKAIQVAVYYCFHQRLESATSCGLQVLVAYPLPLMWGFSTTASFMHVLSIR